MVAALLDHAVEVPCLVSLHVRIFVAVFLCMQMMCLVIMAD